MSTTVYRNPHLLWLILLVLIVGGFAAMAGLPRQEDPRLTNRFPLVLVTWPGAAAERVEALITEPLEEAIRTVSEVAVIEADSSPGIASISIELGDDVLNVEDANRRLRDKVEQVTLPADAHMTFDDERGAIAYSMVVTLTWQGEGPAPEALLTRQAEELAARLRRLAGSEQVQIWGDVREEIRVTLHDADIAALGLTLPQTASIIRQADSKTSAGTLTTHSQRLPVEVAGGFTALDRIGQIPLRTKDGRVIQVDDVATVTHGWREPRDGRAWHNGQPAIIIATRLENGFQLDNWAGPAFAAVDQFRAEQGSLISTDVVFDQRYYTNARLQGLGSNLLAGMGLIIAVIALLMGWRAAVVVGLALPLSVGGLMIGLALLGVPLHQMSLFGTLIALGLLIDNAIVIVDEVRKRLQGGLQPAAAIADAVAHLRGPLTSSTATTVLSFMPIALLPGPAGEFVGTIAVAVITSLIASLILALTVLPALAARLAPPACPNGPGNSNSIHPTSQATLSSQPSQSSQHWLRRSWRDGIAPGPLGRWTENLLTTALRYPAAVILLVVALAAIGFGRARELGQQFFPAADRNMFQIRIWMPPSSNLAQTSAVVEKIDAQLAMRYDVIARQWHAGGSFPTVYYNQIMDTDAAPDYAQGVITVDNPEAAKKIIPQLQTLVDEHVPEAQVVVSPFAQGPPVPAPVMFRIVGPSDHELRLAGEAYRAILAQVPGVTHTQASMIGGQAKLWLAVDENEASQQGWSLRELATRIQTHLDGQTAGSQLTGTHETPVRVQLDQDQRQRPDELTDTYFSSQGRLLHLGSISDLTVAPAASSIFRRNGERTNVISAFVVPEALPPDVTSNALTAFSKAGLSLPPGYRLEVGGDSEESAQASGNLATFAPILMCLMLASVILAFRSVSLAMVIGLVAVLAIGFGLTALRLSGYPFGFNPLLGIAGLIGLAINDSIVVLAAIRADRQAARGDPRAVAVATLHCGRHVIATTLTTIGGFMPLFLAGGDFWPPLAVIIAGGVGGATLLATALVPAAYVLLARWGLVSAPHEPEMPKQAQAGKAPTIIPPINAGPVRGSMA